jgi:hypothetical protein
LERIKSIHVVSNDADKLLLKQNIATGNSFEESAEE